MRPLPPRPGWLPAIDTARCTGCGWCVGACPPHVLSLSTLKWIKRAVLHDAAGCTGCSACAVRCPVHAIAMQRGAGAPSPAAPTHPRGTGAPRRDALPPGRSRW